MSRYKVTASFAMFRHDEEVAVDDKMVICADLDAATRVFLSRIEELTGKVHSSLNYSVIVASAFVYWMLDGGVEQTVHSYTVELHSDPVNIYDEDE